MLKRTSVLCFILVVVASASRSTESLSQSNPGGLKDNACVACHSRLSSPAQLSLSYLEWRVSPHRAAAVGCHKCHGGDPRNRDSKTIHNGVIASSNRASRIHGSNLPQTCGACHQEVVRSFVESAHYQKSSSAQFAPSCTTCHGHMASSVATYPVEAAAYCARCHNTVNGMLPPRPEIPQRARAVMEAIGRTDHLVNWIDELTKEAQSKKIDVAKEKEDLRLLKVLLREAKVGWHAFTMDGALDKANKGFEGGVSIRDRLNRKLGHN